MQFFLYTILNVQFNNVKAFLVAQMVKNPPAMWDT